MTYLLDTNACIQAINRSPGRIAERLRAHSPRAIRLSAVTKAELLYGARHSQRVAENLQLLAAFWQPFICLPFDDPCAEQYGIIRADLASRGQLIGHADLMIAATARAHDLTLVTHNLRDFSRVVGLRLEDWEADPDLPVNSLVIPRMSDHKESELSEEPVECVQGGKEESAEEGQTADLEEITEDGGVQEEGCPALSGLGRRRLHPGEPLPQSRGRREA